MDFETTGSDISLWSWAKNSITPARWEGLHGDNRPHPTTTIWTKHSALANNPDKIQVFSCRINSIFSEYLFVKITHSNNSYLFHFKLMNSNGSQSMKIQVWLSKFSEGTMLKVSPPSDIEHSKNWDTNVKPLLKPYSRILLVNSSIPSQ